MLVLFCHLDYKKKLTQDRSVTQIRLKNTHKKFQSIEYAFESYKKKNSATISQDLSKL